MQQQDIDRSIPLAVSEDDKARLLAPPPPGPVPAPLVFIFRVFETATERLKYTGFSLEPTYKFLNGMFKPLEHYTVRLAIRNIMTGVEVELPEPMEFTVPSDELVIAGFQLSR